MSAQMDGASLLYRMWALQRHLRSLSQRTGLRNSRRANEEGPRSFCYHGRCMRPSIPIHWPSNHFYPKRIRMMSSKIGEGLALRLMVGTSSESVMRIHLSGFNTQRLILLNTPGSIHRSRSISAVCTKQRPSLSHGCLCGIPGTLSRFSARQRSLSLYLIGCMGT
jgi:hypothetical protein